ncbi:MAG: DUF4192 family protein, partial [Ornithinimicrobium sp.]|uniref:DUF4192 family protein n=1 Tax=Ornithinimicrobium sp. TaxID=1977084 RepID=UPI0026DF0486
DDDRSDDDRWLPLPEAADVPLVADLVLQGCSPVATRDELVGRIRDRDEDASDATRLALELLRLDPSRCDVVEALGEFGRWVAHGGPELSARARACLCLTLQDRTLRDVVLSRWVPDPFAADQSLLDDEGVAVWEVIPPLPAALGPRETPSVHRLLHLAARVPQEFTPPLLTLAAFLAWHSGDGSVANEAIELTLQRDPTYRLALLLNEVLLRGIPPWAMSAAEVA